jgi:hypothetical protein
MHRGEALMKYRKAAKNRFRFERIEYRDIFTGCDVLDEFDVSWAGVFSEKKTPLDLRIALRSSSNYKRLVREGWKLEYRRKRGYEWDDWSGVES